MENYIKAYCTARGIAFGQADNSYEIIMLLPKCAVIEIDIMPVLETVVSDEEDLSKIIVSLNHNLVVYRRVL